jgi:hypothetical protein
VSANVGKLFLTYQILGRENASKAIKGYPILSI